jgi:hypothetical protein
MAVAYRDARRHGSPATAYHVALTTLLYDLIGPDAGSVVRELIRSGAEGALDYAQNVIEHAE